jgi:hypothetical protein
VIRSVSRLLVLVWILVGIFVAYDRGYLPERLLRGALSGLLAILVWPLVLLGVNVHI